MKTFNDDNMCFVCGKENPVGLKLDFYYNEKNDSVFSEVDFAAHFQGWKGILHGGIISTVLDEIMVKAAGQKGFKTVTAELTVRFKLPAQLRNRFLISGKVLSHRGRIINCEGSLQEINGPVVATAAGKFFHITDK